MESGGGIGSRRVSVAHHGQRRRSVRRSGFQLLETATNNAVCSYDISSAFFAPSGQIWFTTRTSSLILLERARLRLIPLTAGVSLSRRTELKGLGQPSQHR